MLNTLQEEHKINTAQLRDDLSEMESQLTIRDIELTKLKDHMLMVKKLGGRRSGQSQQAEVITQVEYLCTKSLETLQNFFFCTSRHSNSKLFSCVDIYVSVLVKVKHCK